VRRTFNDARPDKEGSFVLLFPSINLSDGNAIVELSDQFRGLKREDGERIVVTGEAMVLADVLRIIRGDALPVLSATLGGVVLCLWILLGSLSAALLCTLTAALTVALTLSLAGVFQIELNYLNVIVIPVLFGLGVDGGVHIVGRLQQGQPVNVAFTDTWSSIAGALLTTGLSFGALFSAHHPGLRSLATVALLGLSINAITTLGLLTSGLALREHLATLPKRAARLISTVFGAGDIPRGGGTIGAVVALPIIVALDGTPLWMRAVIAVASTLLSQVAIHAYMKGMSGSDDPQEVVLDETIGCLIACIFLPVSLLSVLGGFALFRLLDITKPWPISWVEHKLPGAAGVLFDDVLAGVLAAALMLGLFALL